MFVQYYLMVYFKLLLLLITVIGVQCSQTCGGRLKSKVRIVGGIEVVDYTYPWFVVVHKNGRLHCGGTLISQNVVLSAAHCFRERKADYSILLGMYDVCKYGREKGKFDIDQYYVHEKYIDLDPFYDICLAIIIGDTNKYESVCIPNKVLKPERRGTAALIMGLGETEMNRRYHLYAHKPGKSSPCKLQEAEIKLYGTKECRKVLKKQGFYPQKGSNHVICAGFLKGGIDTCQGDSGGPLAGLDKDGKYFLLGIVSFGEGCARPGELGVYTDVSHFIPWIQEKTTLGLKKTVDVINFSAKITFRD